MKKLFTLLFSSLLLASCQVTDSSSDLQKLNWLEGKWTRTFSATTMVEDWRMQKDTLAGLNFFITNNDSTLMEIMQITAIDDRLNYIARMPDNELLTNFEMTIISTDSVVFENPGNDYPQLIKYKLIGSDSLEATIDGMSNGVRKRAIFGFIRLTDSGSEAVPLS